MRTGPVKLPIKRKPFIALITHIPPQFNRERSELFCDDLAAVKRANRIIRRIYRDNGQLARELAITIMVMVLRNIARSTYGYLGGEEAADIAYKLHAHVKGIKPPRRRS